MKKQITIQPSHSARWLPLAFAAALCLFISPAGLQAQVLYAQGFVNNAGSPQSSSAYEWKVYSGSSARHVSSSRRIVVYKGAPEIENVNAASPYGKDLLRGFYSVAASKISLSYVPVAVDRGRSPNLVLSFAVRNSEDASSTRFAFQAGDVWYVSEEAFNQTTKKFVTYSVALSGSTRFLPLIFIARSNLSISANPSVPFDQIAGNITHVGFFQDPNNDGISTSMRVDNFLLSNQSPGK